MRNFIFNKKVWLIVGKTYLYSLFSLFLLFIVIYSHNFGYKVGYNRGYNRAVDDLERELLGFEIYRKEEDKQAQSEQNGYFPTPTRSLDRGSLIRNVDWGGPQVWEAVNSRRSQLGVNPLDLRTDLCTIASIRLNDLLDLGSLDGHEGFSNFKERRPDLAYIFENYSSVAEFLAAGTSTPEETVSMWENTLGHSQLLKGGEYVWGCIYSQNSFSVAITAF
jgi:hypothetical protein